MFGWNRMRRRPADEKIKADENIKAVEIIDPYMLIRLVADGVAAQVQGSRLPDGETPNFYLSMFNALVSGEYQARRNASNFHLARVSGVEPNVFCPDAKQMQVSLHIAWAAHDGRVLERPDGSLWAVVCVQGSRTRSTLSGIEVDADALVHIDYLYEQAGLFAWRETAELVRLWARPRTQRALDRALDTMPLLTTLTPEAGNQYAVYDPEFGQWHFVAREFAFQPSQQSAGRFRFF
ncbi:hypothetical protein LMG28688_05340 [Paraburkholderia caffeinitolerans]|uniref:Uncharacterized protein n=1 Tax=Paraburkholderia caffeinitolerans TaxID=1723730 RepID=A0A6J5GKT8_9BURK|nr:hypothetical protein [Paraburkholderia caffeinitolerans]CAB3801380.1 hypothetical protein LMG28688_05340 [Paraburkholderia caffeinitolerans]